MVVLKTVMTEIPKTSIECKTECSLPVSAKDFTRILKPYVKKRHALCPLMLIHDEGLGDYSAPAPAVQDHPVTVICYGKSEVWESRLAAEKYYLQGVLETEGSERDRYATILQKLVSGMEICSDEENTVEGGAV